MSELTVIGWSAHRDGFSLDADPDPETGKRPRAYVRQGAPGVWQWSAIHGCSNVGTAGTEDEAKSAAVNWLRSQ